MAAPGRRTFVGEMQHAIEMARIANHDRNPNRAAEVDGWLEHGLRVARARSAGEPLPPRPARPFR